MKKIQKIIIIVGILVILGLIIAYYFVHNLDPYSSIPNINAKEALTQIEGEYYVYYYKKNCPYCIKIEPLFLEFANKEKVYIIDVSKFGNKSKNYDWKSLHEANDIEIGVQNADKSITYFSGEDKEKYLVPQGKNQYGKEKRYEIVVADKEYISSNKNARIGYVYASILTPEINYAEVSNSNDIVIAGVPTLLHINDGHIEGFYFDSEEIAEYIQCILNK